LCRLCAPTLLEKSPVASAPSLFFTAKGLFNMANPKKIATETEVVTVEPTPTPAYDPDNLADVLKRLRSLSSDVRSVSVDIAAHHRKLNGRDPYMAGRLHNLLNAIGEFVNKGGAYA
jgi:hypothetical protein